LEKTVTAKKKNMVIKKTAAKAAAKVVTKPPAKPVAKLPAVKPPVHKPAVKAGPRTPPQRLTSAAAILGRPVARGITTIPSTVKPEWVKYYQVLLDLRERLLNQMSGLAKDSAEELPGYSLHMADSGTDNFDRDFALSLLSSDQDAVYEIEEALKRIERNTFGVCELSGKNIPKARLEAIPWTRFTVEAQAQLERDGSLRQRRLGALGTVDSMATVEVDESEAEEEERPAKERE
jgi:RNA polymerase-binding transcription factor DksA